MYFTKVCVEVIAKSIDSLLYTGTPVVYTLWRWSCFLCLCSVIPWLARNSYSLCALQILGCADDLWVCESGLCLRLSGQWREERPDQAVDLRDKQRQRKMRSWNKKTYKNQTDMQWNRYFTCGIQPRLTANWLGLSGCFRNISHWKKQQHSLYDQQKHTVSSLLTSAKILLYYLQIFWIWMNFYFYFQFIFVLVIWSILLLLFNISI